MTVIPKMIARIAAKILGILKRITSSERLNFGSAVNTRERGSVPEPLHRSPERLQDVELAHFRHGHVLVS
jgi:hypothetical protein